MVKPITEKINVFLKSVFGFPIYPILLCLAPILILFQNNSGEVSVNELVMPLAASIFVTCLLFLLLRLAFRSWDKAGLVLAGIILVVFSYGYVVQFLTSIPLPAVIDPDLSMFGWNKLLYIAIGLLGFLFVGWVWFSKRNFDVIRSYLNICALILLVLPIFTIGSIVVRGLDVTVDSSVDVTAQSGRSARQLRDIYYLVPEDYASGRILKEDFNFDNSDFTNFLQQQGFYVANQSRTNYARSSFSIASTLSLNYLQTLKPLSSDPRPEVSTVFTRLQDHEVGRFLQSKGYKYIHMSSWFQPTKTSAIADEVINYSSTKLDLTNFQRLIINQSILAPLFNHWFNLNEFEQQYYGLEYQFREFPAIVSQPGLKFVFAHIILPHGPAVYDKDCHEMTSQQVQSQSIMQNYLGQIQCANIKLKAVITDIRSNDPSAIIVLQSDEGSPGIAYDMPDDEYHFSGTSREIRDERTSMLSAYYFPAGGDEVLYPSISPVNSFRLLFNYYFGTNYSKLPDKTYLTSDSNHLFDFIDATSELEK